MHIKKTSIKTEIFKAMQYEDVQQLSQYSFNPFMPNEISHHYDLDESISNFRVVGLYISFLLTFLKLHTL